MRLLIILVLFSFTYIVSCKTHVKALTESMGQEVIEINSPVKELPMGLEEEPASDKEDKIKTKEPQSLEGEYKRMSTISGKENMKDVDRIDGLNTESEEDRIEKELAEIYKDTADYKSDSGEEEVAKEVSEDHHTQEATVQEFKSKYDSDYKNDSGEETDETSTTPDENTEEPIPTAAGDEQTNRPIARARNSFKLHPDSTGKADIERFRTSVDEINCNANKQLLNQVYQEQEYPTPFTSIYPKTTNGRDGGSKAFYTTASQLPLIAAILGIFFVYI
ncbi:uncharacterized protein LOC111360975 [Spodoptera litura]|uniref:Uncharacterized protein LOC111360975 n=1 Tax=Spodoptera litura TaxID=69820 RepID=A0A9J7ERC9_SPOLT|nr:uncharacterized protein LOC111360975 [Spodoptera litura]